MFNAKPRGVMKKVWYFCGGVFFILLISCSGFISLDLPNPATITFNENWLMLGRNPEHTHNAYHNIHPPLEKVWSKRVKSVVTDHPLALGDIIFAPTRSGDLYVIDYQTGAGIGTGRLGPAMEHSPSIDNNYLYAGFNLGNKTFLAFNLRFARKKYTLSYPHVTTSPLIVNDRIYFGTDDGVLYCLSKSNGREEWSFSTRAPIHSSPAAHQSIIVFGDDKGWLYALDAQRGILKWETPLEGTIFAHPVIDDSLIFIGTVSGNMYCLNLMNGKVVWKKSVSGAIYSGVSVYKNVIYFGNNAHQVVALHKSTGDIVWEFMTKGIVNTVPLPSPDYLYVTSWDKHLYVLNRFSGEHVFQYEFKKTPKSSPIIYRDYILVHSANAELVALANEKFVKEWREKQ